MTLPADPAMPAADDDTAERPVPAPHKAFRIREIVLAVALGALAAGGAAITLAALDDGDSQVEVQHAPVTRTYPLAAFDRISVSGPQDVVVTRGDAISVRAEGSSEALDRLAITVTDGKLSIQPKFGVLDQDGHLFDDVTVRVTLPALQQLEISGPGDIHIDRITGKRFAASVSGSGSVSIDILQVDQAEFDVTASGELKVAGTAAETRVDASGSAEVSAEYLHSGTATVAASGSASAALFVSGAVQVSASGSATADISGPAQCTVSQSGSGEVNCSGNAPDDPD